MAPAPFPASVRRSRRSACRTISPPISLWLQKLRRFSTPYSKCLSTVFSIGDRMITEPLFRGKAQTLFVVAVLILALFAGAFHTHRGASGADDCVLCHALAQISIGPIASILTTPLAVPTERLSAGLDVFKPSPGGPAQLSPRAPPQA